MMGQIMPCNVHVSSRQVTGITDVHPVAQNFEDSVGQDSAVWSEYFLILKEKNVMTTVTLLVIPGMCKLTETNASQSFLIN